MKLSLRLTLTLLFCVSAYLPGHLEAQTPNRPTGAGQGGANNANRPATGAGASTGPRQYRSNTLLGDATIQIDPETRSLIVVTDEATHAELQKVIKDLDQPKPQVLINVVFVEVTYNKGSDVGIEGSYTFNNQTPGSPASTGTTERTVTNTRPTANGGTRETVTSTSATTAAGEILAQAVTAGTNFGLASLTDGTFVRVLADDWTATLRALATRGKVEVLSRPSIMARNNQEAVIVVGQEVPFITNSRITDDGQTINTIQYDNIGIILKVTPFITSEGTVEMIVAPEISTLTDETVPISNTASAPVIAKRSAETVVVTPNGATAVIGGLMETQRTEFIRKVPLLGDIPLLGMAFRRTIKDDTKRELMIFLTPTIINNPASLQKATHKEMDRTSIIEGSFSDKELNRYLDVQPLPDDLPILEDKEVRPATLVTPTVEIKKAPPSR